MTARFACQDMIDQAERADMRQPVEATELIESIDAAEPIEPIERTDPTEPMDRTDPDDPIESSEPCDAIDHRERTRRRLRMARMLPQDPPEGGGRYPGREVDRTREQFRDGEVVGVPQVVIRPTALPRRGASSACC